MVAYNRDIPDTPNNPSVDQPKMKTNTNSIDTLIGVDHISFNASDGGTHLQTSFVGFSAGTVVGGVPASVAYPAAGVADNTHAQYYFKNSTNTFPLSSVRAYALVTGSTGAIIAGQSFNASVVRNSTGNYTVTLTANATSTADYGVFIQSGRSSDGITVTINSPTQFTILTTTLILNSPIATDLTRFYFSVIQL